MRAHTREEECTNGKEYIWKGDGNKADSEDLILVISASRCDHQRSTAVKARGCEQG